MTAVVAEIPVELVLTSCPVAEDMRVVVVKLDELVYTSFSQLDGKTRFFAVGSRADAGRGRLLPLAMSAVVTVA